MIPTTSTTLTTDLTIETSPTKDYKLNIDHKISVIERGKNLIPFPYAAGGVGTVKKSYGITYTVNSDGSIKAEGTSTGWASFNLGANFNLKDGVRYNLSGDVIIRYLKDGKTSWFSNSMSFVWKKEYILDYVYIQYANGQVANTTHYPRIEEASEVKTE